MISAGIRTSKVWTSIIACSLLLPGRLSADREQ
jgi:hypothetical protein